MYRSAGNLYPVFRICILSAVIILYRNLALMTSVTTDDMRLKVLRVTTVFNIMILVALIAVAALTAADIIHFTEERVTDGCGKEMEVEVWVMDCFFKKRT